MDEPQPPAPAGAGNFRFTLKAVIITGSTVYSDAALTPLYAGFIGREITVADIYAVAGRISARYGQDGYLGARTTIVPQSADANGAIIHMVVTEGFIERIDWPERAVRYRDFFAPCLDSIKAERPARISTIEGCLLRASDLPGLTFTSTVKAGDAKTGGAVLAVEMVEKPVDLAVQIDNTGSHGRGPWQYSTAATANNWLGLHESLGLVYAGAVQTNELQYVAGTYQQTLTADGLRLDLFAGYSTGEPGLTPLRDLNFASKSVTFEAGLTYPLIRTRERNLSLSVLGFATDTWSELLDSPNTEDRLRGVRLRSSYDEVDTTFGTLGQTQARITVSRGIDGLGSTENNQPRASVAGGRVDFTKIEGRVSRTQLLGEGVSVFGAASGQYSGTTLLAPEQCGYGGRLIGRAFDPDELLGDRCWAVASELRYDLTIPDNPFSRTQLYSFADYGTVYRIGAGTGTPARQHGATAGIGLRLAVKDAINADLAAARPIDGPRDKDWRVLFSLSARY